MPISRRHALKMLASLPLLSNPFNALNKLVGTFVSQSCSCTNVLLHGFFFLEIQDNVLWAASPIAPNHEGHMRKHGDTATTRIHGLQNLTQLKATTPNGTFPAEMIRFSRKDIGLTTPFIDSQAVAKYELLLKLPIPNNILLLRNDLFSHFTPQPGNVATSINQLHPGNLVPLIICLQYDPDPSLPATQIFYAEPNINHIDQHHVDAALDAARTAFTSLFDLHITITGSDKPTDCDKDLPSEISTDDEKSLFAVLNGRPCFDPPPPVRPTGKKKKKIVGLAVEVATCPQFGVTP